MTTPNVLPDSRLYDTSLETIIGDWQLPDGTTVRIEIQPVFCANCGKKYGHIPAENTAFAFYLCNKCFETYGDIAGTYAMPDDEFNKNLENEMVNKFGRCLTEQEVFILSGQGRLGNSLENLIKDSPYPKPKT